MWVQAIRTFGYKGSGPAQRRGAAGRGVTAKEGLGLVHKEALVLIQRGGLHRQECGILKFRVGAGDRARAKRAGAPRESQLVSFQLWKETNNFELYTSKIIETGTSLVVQWLRICLPMQGTRVRALVREDPTCRGATKPVSHNY